MVAAQRHGESYRILLVCAALDSGSEQYSNYRIRCHVAVQADTPSSVVDFAIGAHSRGERDRDTRAGTGVHLAAFRKLHFEAGSQSREERRQSCSWRTIANVAAVRFVAGAWEASIAPGP